MIALLVMGMVVPCPAKWGPLYTCTKSSCEEVGELSGSNPRHLHCARATENLTCPQLPRIVLHRSWRIKHAFVWLGSSGQEATKRAGCVKRAYPWLLSRVHGANKLAAKHDRVDLSKGGEVSQCDICQDRPAVLFCSEDRALICRRCVLTFYHSAVCWVFMHLATFFVCTLVLSRTLLRSPRHLAGVM